MIILTITRYFNTDRRAILRMPEIFQKCLNGYVNNDWRDNYVNNDWRDFVTMTCYLNKTCLCGSPLSASHKVALFTRH